MSEFRSQLEEFETAWKEASAESVFDNLPDGKYQVGIEEVRLENAKKSGRLQLAWVLTVMNGDYAGRKVFHYRGLDREESVGWMKREIYACGLEVESILDLPDMLPELLDRVVEITLKTKRGSDGEDYQNCFINRLLDEPSFDVSPSFDVGPNDDPFVF